MSVGLDERGYCGAMGTGDRQQRVQTGIWGWKGGNRSLFLAMEWKKGTGCKAIAWKQNVLQVFSSVGKASRCVWNEVTDRDVLLTESCLITVCMRGTRIQDASSKPPFPYVHSTTPRFPVAWTNLGVQLTVPQLSQESYGSCPGDQFFCTRYESIKR